ncbi:transposase [[Clostridium] aminophilum]|uniref:transposase n=1 Tax=[Clostridium] aminophilum TaxID=1526 RepID=UPI00068A4DF5
MKPLCVRIVVSEFPNLLRKDYLKEGKDLPTLHYSNELKEVLLRRMLPPNNESIHKIAREEGISEQNLRNWRDKARAEGIATPGKDAVADE